MLKIVKLLCFIFFLVIPHCVFAKDNLYNYSIKIIEPLDQRVAIKFPDESIKILKVGDKLGDTFAVITEILADKLVLEESITTLSNTIEKQKIIIVKRDGYQQQIVRLQLNDTDSREWTPTDLNTDVLIPIK